MVNLDRLGAKNWKLPLVILTHVFLTALDAFLAQFHQFAHLEGEAAIAALKSLLGRRVPPTVCGITAEFLEVAAPTASVLHKLLEVLVLSEEGVLQSLRGSDTLLGTDFQHLLQEVYPGRGQFGSVTGLEVDLAKAVLAEDVVELAPGEGGSTQSQQVEDHP